MIIAYLQNDDPYGRRKNATCDCLIANASSQTPEAKHIQTQLKQQGYTYVEPQGFELAQSQNKPVFTRAFYVGQSQYNHGIYCDFILFHPQLYPQCLIIDRAIHLHMDEFGMMRGGEKQNYDEYCEELADFDQYEEDHDFEATSVWIRYVRDSYTSPTILVPDDGYYEKNPQEIISCTSNELRQFNIEHIFSKSQFSTWAANGGI